MAVERIAKAVPSSEIELDPEAGHAPYVSNPREFVRRVMEFA